ncbi:MAG: YceD family protein [Clostridia bacterium]
MKFNIASVLKNEGSAMAIEGNLELGRLKYLGNSFDFQSPVSVKGVIRNIGGTLELNGTVSGEYVSSCDCCGAPVKGVLEAEIDEAIDSESEDYDAECFALNGTILDISGLINALVWGNLPMKLLCREDCKGLCSICGCNLNETVCNCDHTVYDPRLAILREQAEK